MSKDSENRPDEEQEKLNAEALHIKTILTSALGTNGLLLRDSNVEFLIDLLDAYLEENEE